MPPIVKLFVLALVQPTVEISFVKEMLSEVFGSIDYVSEPLLFDCTDYYESEMGPNLARSIISFTGPHHADILVGAKRACIELEKGCAVEGRRTINLDSGYLDPHKIVLASTKGAGQKIYIDEGIYADLIARYARGSYEVLPWGFPDFKDGRYAKDFLAVRSLLQGSAT